MASAPEVHEAAAPLLTSAAMRGWGVEEVVQWTLMIDRLDADEAAIFAQNKITGADLVDRVTAVALERWGMLAAPLGVS